MSANKEQPPWVPAADQTCKFPCSKGAVNRLGERLKAGEENPDDLDLLDRLLLIYDGAGGLVVDELATMGIASTSRAKSRDTLTDKLHRLGRLGNHGLARVDDVAGVRCVAGASIRAQNDLVARLIEHFTVAGKPPREKDHRVDCPHGYRAVHVIAMVGDCLVEIQVRTELQDAWAQVTEGLGEKWGRELRYGEPIRDADKPITAGSDVTRSEMFAACLGVSKSIRELEEEEAELAGLRRRLRPARSWRRLRGDPMLLVKQPLIGVRLFRMRRAQSRLYRGVQKQRATMIMILDHLLEIVQSIKVET